MTTTNGTRHRSSCCQIKEKESLLEPKNEDYLFLTQCLKAHVLCKARKESSLSGIVKVRKICLKD
jgi:hypothetical protein